MLTKAQEEKLSELCRLAFESLVGQIIVDKEGTILYFSKEHTKFLGIKKEDAEGRFVRDVLPETRMDIVVKTGIPEIGNIFKMVHRETKKVKYMVCNRIPIWDKEGNIVGAMAETIFSRGLDDVHRINREIGEHATPNLFTDERDYYGDLGIGNENNILSGKLEEQVSTVSKVRGKSRQIIELQHLISRIANMPLPVLITGETGTGKEVFAEALHLAGDERHKHNFVKINCAAIPSELLESEFFGYEKGAFSGANSSGKMGKFEYAGNGTVLLDEIGDMPLDLQAKLLRVLQEKEFERIGGLKTIPFNARVICTTNRNIRKRVKEGKFREDLFYRINVLELYIPPLRERKEDILELSRVFIGQLNDEYDLKVTGINLDVIEMLNNYSWPGNVRELKHAIERACMMRTMGNLRVDDFFFLQNEVENLHSSAFDSQGLTLNLKCVRQEAEQNAIRKAIEITYGNKAQAAKILGIERTVLYDKLKKYGISD